MINKSQHGFLHGRSCVTQLLATLHHIGQLLDRNVQTDVLFLDFAKAFDSVDHTAQFVNGFIVNSNLILGNGAICCTPGLPVKRRLHIVHSFAVLFTISRP
jgi:hypothetical protein